MSARSDDAARGAASPPPDGLVWERDFGARYGEGLRFGLSLGGGGMFFVAWQVTYLYELAKRGVELRGADRVVGTSAGSLVSTALEAGRLSRVHTELQLLSKLPKILSLIAPSGDLHPSQLRALDAFHLAGDSQPETLRSIGHAALAAGTPNPSVMSRNIGVVLAVRRWPSPALHITCVDTFTGERCVITGASRVGIARAAAASSAVPGLFAPQPILDRRCMDGGVSGTGIHLDLLAGAGRVVVLCLTDGSAATEDGMTMKPTSVSDELEGLRASGSEVFFRTPESMDIERLMDPTAIPGAIDMGRRQAAADAEELRAFLS